MNKNIKFIAIAFIFSGFLFFSGNLNVYAKTVIINEASEWKGAVEDTTIDEIKLGKNIDLTTAIINQTLPSLDVDSNATTRTLDLNGNELQVSTDALNINFGVEGATVIIKDSSESKTGKIIHTSTDSALINIFYDSNITKGNVIIDGGTYICHNNTNSDYGAIFNQGNTNITINSGTFDSRALVSGTIPYLTIKGVVLFNSVATSNSTAASILMDDIGRTTLGSVVGSNHSVYIRKSDGTEKKIESWLQASSTVTSLDSTATYTDSIIVKENEGFQIKDINFDEVYGYSNVSQNISIKNNGSNPLTIQNVTLDNYDGFTVEGKSQAIVESGATNTSWVIKVKEGLNVGTYTAILTVTDENNNSYVGYVTINVEEKNLPNLNISFTDKLYYGESNDVDPVITGIEGLNSSDYKIEYSKTDTEDWSSTRPTLVGNYNIRITITNTNYEENSAVTEFRILPTEKVVKIVANSSSHVYDGKLYSDNGFTVYFDGKETENRTLFYNDTVSNILVIGAIKDVKDNKEGNNLVSKEALVITNRDCYKNIEIVNGTISIEPSTNQLYVYADTVKNKYNGKALVSKGFVYNSGVLLDNEEIIVAVEGSQLYVGSSDNIIIDVQILRDNVDITSNYIINKVNGKLTVESAEQEVNIVSNITVKVGTKLTIDKIKELLGEKAFSYEIKMKNATNSTFDETNGFVAGNSAEIVTMEAISTAEDINNDGLFEYKEGKAEFTITVEEKDVVNLSGLTYTDKYYDKNPIEPTGALVIENNLVSKDDIETLYKGTGNTNYESTEAPTNAGTYEVTYKVSDENPTYAGSVSYTFSIMKSKVEIPDEDSNKYTYNKESQTISIIYDENLIELTGASSGINAGEYSYTLALKDKDNYEWTDGTSKDLVRNWKIEKVNPEYTIPNGLNGIKGQALIEIVLDGRFTWDNPQEKLLAGNHTYKATYTPEDTNNYNTIKNIDVNVFAKDTFTITGLVTEGKGSINYPKNEIVDNETVIVTFVPEIGYMINKVLVNGEEITISGNELELIMTENKEIQVSYKKIPFTITVKNNDNAVITPDGIISVVYGDSKEFTITANYGYKLVKVLINNEDKISDKKDNTLVISNITYDTTIEVVVEEIIYEFIEGSSKTINKGNDAVFRINASYDLFENKVYVDDQLLSSDNYTSKSGSTIITLNKSYIDTLSIGKHTLRVTFADGGEAINEFIVANKIVKENPETYDSVKDYIVLSVVSLIGITVTLAIKKKYVIK